MTFSSSELRDQVRIATDAIVEDINDYDVDAIVEDIVEAHGAVDVDTIDSGEFWETVGRHELWSASKVAFKLGYDGPNREASVRKTLSRWGVKAARYQPHHSSGRPQAMYRAQEVRDARAARPGQGARTDKKPAQS